MRDRRRRLCSLVSAVATWTLLGAGCGGDRATAPPPVARVVVTAPATLLQFGEAVTVTAAVLGADGRPLTGRAVQWSSSQEALATVSATGVVTAGAVRGGTPEPVTITASSEGVAGTVALSVAPVPAAAVALTPGALTLSPGQTQAVAALLRDATGGTLSGRTITWSSSAPAVATVSAQGVVTGVAAGTAFIAARSDAARDSVAVVVVPAARLVFDVVPAQLPPRFGVGIVVRATLTGSDTLAGFAGTVTLQGEEGAVPFLGQPTAVARGGVATFHDLAITTAGSYRLRATAPQLGAAVSPPITVAATSTLPTIAVGTVTRSVVGAGYPGTSRYQVPVTLRDGAGQLAGPTPVTAAIVRGSATVLAGATTVTTAQGVATFDLTLRGTETLDLLLTAPGYQAKVQGVANPTSTVAAVLAQRQGADSVVAVGAVARISATLANRSAASAHAVTYEVSWNPAQLSLATDTMAVSTAPAINRTQLAEGVLRVTLAESSRLATAGAEVVLQRLQLLVRPGASGEQRVRIVTLELRGATGELLAPRATAETSFRVP
jgi:hypothetical protein